MRRGQKVEEVYTPSSRRESEEIYHPVIYTHHPLPANCGQDSRTDDLSRRKLLGI